MYSTEMHTIMLLLIIVDNYNIIIKLYVEKSINHPQLYMMGTSSQSSTDSRHRPCTVGEKVQC